MSYRRCRFWRQPERTCFICVTIRSVARESRNAAKTCTQHRWNQIGKQLHQKLFARNAEGKTFKILYSVQKSLAWYGSLGRLYFHISVIAGQSINPPGSMECWRCLNNLYGTIKTLPDATSLMWGCSPCLNARPNLLRYSTPIGSNYSWQGSRAIDTE